jgi:hypothetical protein
MVNAVTLQPAAAQPSEAVARNSTSAGRALSTAVLGADLRSARATVLCLLWPPRPQCLYQAFHQSLSRHQQSQYLPQLQVYRPLQRLLLHLPQVHPLFQLTYRRTDVAVRREVGLRVKDRRLGVAAATMDGVGVRTIIVD